MKKSNINVFWVGFGVTAALTLWIYWIVRQKRVVAPEPIIVSHSPAGKPGRFAETEKGNRQVMVSEPLEEIRGIGPTFANRLNDAGIYTFAQLAATPASEIQQITGVTRWDPAEWIAEANKLTGAD